MDQAGGRSFGCAAPCCQMAGRADRAGGGLALRGGSRLLPIGPVCGHVCLMESIAGHDGERGKRLTEAVQAARAVSSASQGAPDAADIALMEQFLRKPGFLLARIGQISTAIFGRASGMTTLNQAEFLLLLERLGPMIQIALAGASGVDKSTTATILDNLEARGWVERSIRAHDRRSSLVALTQAGQAALPAVRADFAGLQRDLEAPFTPRELSVLIARLHRLGRNGAPPAPLWRSACDPVSGVLDVALSFLTRRALQLLHGQFLATTQGTRLTLRQFSLLFILSRREPITQSAFARLFGLDPATCAVVMRGPTRRGLIAGAPSPEDGRARLYTLTAAGRALLEEVQPLVDQSEALVFGQFSASERDEIVEWLRRIVLGYSHLLRFPGAIGAR